METNEIAVQFKEVHSSKKDKVESKGLFTKFVRSIRPKYQEAEVLRDVDVQIKQGQSVALVSQSEELVEEFIKLLIGEITPSKGNIKVFNKTPEKKDESFGKLISYFSNSNPQLWNELSTKEIFKLIKTKYKLNTEEFESNVEKLSELLEIKDLLKIQVKKLTPERKSKCELLVSLLHNPRILIVDNYQEGIDTQTQKQIREFLKYINALHKTTIILATSQMEDITELCTNVVIFNNNSIAYEGAIKALLEKYANHKYVKMKFDKEVVENELELYGKIVNYGLMEATIAIPREEQGRISSDIVTNLPVNDMQVVEPPLEDMIKDIVAAKAQIEEKN